MPIKHPRWPPRNLVFLTFQHQTAVISRASSRSPCFHIFSFFIPCCEYTNDSWQIFNSNLHSVPLGAPRPRAGQFLTDASGQTDDPLTSLDSGPDATGQLGARGHRSTIRQCDRFNPTGPLKFIYLLEVARFTYVFVKLLENTHFLINLMSQT